LVKRHADADHRRFLDEFDSVRVSRLRASGVIDPAKREAVIPFPDGSTKLIGVGHTHLKYGGGWSFFICLAAPRSPRRSPPSTAGRFAGAAVTSSTLGIAANGAWAARSAYEPLIKSLDQLIAKLETTEPLRLKPTPASWGGKARLVHRSRRLTMLMNTRAARQRGLA
jgi:hypothetical protein